MFNFLKKKKEKKYGEYKCRVPTIGIIGYKHFIDIKVYVQIIKEYKQAYEIKSIHIIESSDDLIDDIKNLILKRIPTIVLKNMIKNVRIQ